MPSTYSRYIIAVSYLVAAICLAAATYRVHQLTEVFRAPSTQVNSAN